jgi:hypothetical protein
MHLGLGTLHGTPIPLFSQLERLEALIPHNINRDGHRGWRLATENFYYRTSEARARHYMTGSSGVAVNTTTYRLRWPMDGPRLGHRSGVYLQR